MVRASFIFSSRCKTPPDDARMSVDKSDKAEKLSDKVVIKGDKAMPNRLNINNFYQKAL